MSDEKWIRYAALIEPIGEDDPDSGDEPRSYSVDAISFKELEKLRYERDNLGQSYLADPIRFLALSIDKVVGRTINSPTWVNIEVSRGVSGRNQAVPARSAFPGPPEGDQPREAEFFLNLLSAPVPPSSLDGLRYLAQLPGVGDSSRGSISQTINLSAKRMAGVAVYDVGQANLNALVDRYEHPMLFFDLGWPMSKYNGSLPRNPRFNPLVSPISDGVPVVLSHLDWDHWGYAIESGKALDDHVSGGWRTEPTYRSAALQRPWIAKRPKFKRHSLGASHIHFMQTLSGMRLPDGSSVLRFWPERSSSIKVGPVTIFSCKPSGTRRRDPGFLRNNEGLGVSLVRDDASVLLCGDADYPSIPARFMTGLTGIVAPHHGGKTTPGGMPMPMKRDCPMAMSTHSGCYPSIPSPSVLAEAGSLGWNVVRTDTRIPCARCGAVHGNLLIPLSAMPRCGCMAVDCSGLCVVS